MNDIEIFGCEFNETLGCFVKYIEYDFVSKTGHVLIHKRSVTDRKGIDKVFNTIDKDWKIVNIYRADDENIGNFYHQYQNPYPYI